MYGYYITQKGADLMAQALLDESKVIITQCAVGDGGDAEAEKDLSRTALNNETYRKSFDIEDSYALAPDDTDTVMIECIIPSEAGELTVSEIGFLDESDNLIAYGVLKEQVLGSDSDGLEYSLDIVSFIELTSEQLSVLKVDLGKANVQAISERVDEFESTVNNNISTFETNVNKTVDEFKTDINGTVNTFEERVEKLEEAVESGSSGGGGGGEVLEPVYLCSGPDFKTRMSGLNTYYYVVFTTDFPPEGKNLTDLSKNNDNSIVAWVDNYDTAHIYGKNKRIVADQDCSEMFHYSWTRTIDFSNFDTSQVTDMSHMFDACQNIISLDLTNFDTSQVTDMSFMFCNCTKLGTLDLTNFDTSHVTNMNSMFDSCGSLLTLDITNFDTSQVTDMSNMFEDCTKLTKLDLSSFDTSNVTTMFEMFYSLEKVEYLNLSNFDTSNVTNMCRMFDNCGAKTLNISSFNTGNVTNMEGMFESCPNLTALDLSNFNTSKVETMREMFHDSYIIHLDLSSFDTSNVTIMDGMFQACKSKSIDVSNFDTSKVTSMGSLFYGSKIIYANLSRWNTSSLKYAGYMFRNCSFPYIDVSGFDFSKLTIADYMFDSPNIKKIYCNTDWSSKGYFKDTTYTIFNADFENGSSGKNAKPKSQGGNFTPLNTVSERLNYIEYLLKGRSPEAYDEETYHIVINNASSVSTFYVRESADRNGVLSKTFNNSSKMSTFEFDLVLKGEEIRNIEEELWLLDAPLRTSPGDATYGVSGNGIRMGYSFEDGKTYTYDWNNAKGLSDTRNY